MTYVECNLGQNSFHGDLDLELDDVISGLHSQNAEQHEKAGCCGINEPSADCDHSRPHRTEKWWKKYFHRDFPRTWIITLRKNSIPIIFSSGGNFSAQKLLRSLPNSDKEKWFQIFRQLITFSLIQPTLDAHRFVEIGSSVRSRDVVQSDFCLPWWRKRENLRVPRRLRL